MPMTGEYDLPRALAALDPLYLVGLRGQAVLVTTPFSVSEITYCSLAQGSLFFVVVVGVA